MEWRIFRYTEKYSKEQFAQDWVNGKVKITDKSSNDGRGSILIGDKRYTVNMPSEQLNNILYQNPDGTVRNGSIVGNFGTPEDYVNLKQSLNQKILKSLNINNNGIITPRFGVDPSDPATAATAMAATKEMASPSVAPFVYYDAAKKGNELGENELATFRSILGNSDRTKKWINHIGKTIAPDGTPAYDIDVNPDQVDVKNDANFKHTRYIIPIASLENAPVLASIPTKNTFMYSDMYNPKKTIKSDPVTEGYGQSFELRGVDPGPDGNATAVYAMLKLSKPDKKNPGQFIYTDHTYKIPTVGKNGKNSEEIMNFVYDRINHSLQESDDILKHIHDENAALAQEYEAAAQQSKR